MDQNLHTLLLVCIRQRRKMAAFFFTAMTLSLLAAVFAPKKYRSEAKLLVRLGRENVVLDSAATLGDSATIAMPLSREFELNSVVAIAKSRALLEEVVDALGPGVVLNKTGDKGGAGDGGSRPQTVHAGVAAWLSELSISEPLPEREKAVLQLMKSVWVGTAHKSDVVEVSCLGPTPELAQAVVAKLVDLYVEQHIGFNRTPKAHAFFERQTARLRDELRAGEKKLVKLKNETGVSSPEEQRKLLVAQIDHLETELLAAEASAKAVQAELRKIEEKQAAYPTTEVTSRITGFANEAADAMRAKFYELELKEQELLAKYTEIHPEVKLVRDQIAGSRNSLAGEDRSLAQLTVGRGRASAEAELILLQREPQLASHLAQAEKLRQQLTAALDSLRTLTEHEQQIVALAREVELTGASYRKYREGLEQARIDEALQAERISNLSVVQPASYELQPTASKRWVTLALGLIIGVCGSVALAWLAEAFSGFRARALLNAHDSIQERNDQEGPATVFSEA